MTPLELADKLEQLMKTTKVDYTVQEAADMIRELHLKNRELQMRMDAMAVRVEYL
jgi:hypothetical protein